MRQFRIALAQMNPTVGDIAGNAAAIRERIDRAEAAGADLVAFPELVLTGYPPEDLVLRRRFVQDNLDALDAQSRQLADRVSELAPAQEEDNCCTGRNGGGAKANGYCVATRGTGLTRGKG